MLFLEFRVQVLERTHQGRKEPFKGIPDLYLQCRLRMSLLHLKWILRGVRLIFVIEERKFDSLYWLEVTFVEPQHLAKFWLCSQPVEKVHQLRASSNPTDSLDDLEVVSNRVPRSIFRFYV